VFVHFFFEKFNIFHLHNEERKNKKGIFCRMTTTLPNEMIISGRQKKYQKLKCGDWIFLMDRSRNHIRGMACVKATSHQGRKNTRIMFDACIVFSEPYPACIPYDSTAIYDSVMKAYVNASLKTEPVTVMEPNCLGCAASMQIYEMSSDIVHAQNRLVATQQQLIEMFRVEQTPIPEIT